MLMATTPPVSEYFFISVLRQQQGKVMYCVLPSASASFKHSRFLGLFCDSHVRITCSDDCMHPKWRGVPVPLALKMCERFDRIGYGMVLEGPLFHSLCFHLHLEVE